MKNQITTIVDDHAKHFELLIRSISSKFQVIWIFCYAKDVSFNFSDGTFKQSNLEPFGQYSLLLVTETSTRIDGDVQDFVDHVYKHGKVNIICHGRKNIFDAISKNNRFFTEIISKGELLYAQNGIMQQWPDVAFDYSLGSQKARIRYGYHFSVAKGFLIAANASLSEVSCGVCVLNLHHAVEQCCLGMLRVFLSYKAEFRNIKRLLDLCTAFSDIPYHFFSSTSPNDQRLFKMLVDSFKLARYSKGFLVADNDAQQLYEKIEEFMKITQDLCERKVLELEQTYRQSQESEVQNG